jgi:hypothetical protein
MGETETWLFDMFFTGSLQIYGAIFSLDLRSITTSVIKHSVTGNQ